MSQRECAGFNWPPLSIAAQEPISSSPETVNRAGPVIRAICASDDPVMFGVIIPPLAPSDAVGVVQPAKIAE